MVISNVNATNQSISVNRTNSPVATHVERRERPKEDRSDSTVVNLSTHARDLHRQEAAQEQQDHVERIRELSRSDEMAQEKMQANANAEARALEAKQKIDEKFYKRINVQA